MEITFKNEEGCRKVYDVSAPWEEIEPRYATVAHTLRSRAHIPGFRPGKAPESVLRSRFRKEIREEVLEHLLEDAAKAMVEQHHLQPVVEPYASSIHLDEGQPFTCELTAEQAPEIPEVDAVGLAIEVPRIEVTDKQVDEAVESLRQRAAVMRPLETPAEEGDYAVVMLHRKGQSKGVEKFFRALAASDQAIEKVLGGKKAGDEFDLTVDEDEHDAAKEDGNEHDHAHDHAHMTPGEYTIKVTKVVRREVPEANDDLAKDLGAESFEVLKAKVREDMEARVQADLKGMKEDRLIEAILEKHSFSVPPTLVERQLRRDLEEFAEGLAGQGLKLDQAGIDWEKMAVARRPIAERKVAAYYLLESVAKRLGMEATEADISAYFEGKTAGTKITAEQFRAHTEKEDQMGMVKTLITHNKALDLLLSQASVTLTAGANTAQEAQHGVDPDSRGADEPR
jgi:trigger factor